MLLPSLKDTQRTHIEALVTSGVRENRLIEFKLKLPGAVDSEKIPWLIKPVCSFANTDGGDLLFGIQAKDGVAIGYPGVEITNLDQEKLRIEQMLQTGIQPQVRGIQIHEIPIAEGKYVLIVRVPQSWTSPHRAKDNQFYARNNSGAYPLDVPQIRQAFLLSETLSERIRNFRAERIGMLSGQGGPAQLCAGVRIALHIVPSRALFLETNFQLIHIKTRRIS